MDLNGDLSSIFGSLFEGKRADVYLSVTPGIGLEMIQVDYPNKQVKSYSVRPISYNESLRELTNMEEFKTAVSEMFTELNINPKCNVILNLPTVLFGSMDINLMLGDEAIMGAATSEVEQSYVFKRHDPMVKWIDSNTGTSENRKIFYSAVQELVVKNISTALEELGAYLESVHMSLISTLKALDFSGIAEEQMNSGSIWNIMVVNGTGYNLISMAGRNIVDYYEEPIPVNSYEGDEIYNAISASAQISLMSAPANYLVVISDTSSVSAEILAKNLNVDCEWKAVENNKFNQEPFVPATLDVLPEVAAKISLQAIGCAISRVSSYPISIDFLSSSNVEIKKPPETVTIPFGEDSITITPMQAAIVCGAFFVIILSVLAIVGLKVLPDKQQVLQTEMDSLLAENRKIEKEIEQLKTAMDATDTFNVKEEISNTLKLNRTKLIAYSAIGESVPNNLWLDRFETTEEGKIKVEGGAGTVEDVYTFYKNLKEATGANDLKLNKLEMTSVDDFLSNSTVAYDFVIANFTPKPVQQVDDKNKKK